MTHKKKHALLSLLCTFAAAAALGLPSLAAAAAPLTGCESSSRKCFVDVTVTGAPGSYTVTFDPDVLQIKNSELGKEYRWVVRLKTQGFRFQPSQGDGVFIKDPDKDEFYDGHVTDDDSGGSSSVKRGWKRWHWKFINSVDGRYRYKVVFHDTAGNVVVGDPVISNIDAH